MADKLLASSTKWWAFSTSFLSCQILHTLVWQ